MLLSTCCGAANLSTEVVAIAVVLLGAVHVEVAFVVRVVEGEPLALLVGEVLAFVQATLGIGSRLLAEVRPVAASGDVADGFFDRTPLLTARAPLVFLLLAVSLHQVAQVGVRVVGEPSAVSGLLAADAAIQELGVVLGRHQSAQVAELSVADQVQRRAGLFSGHAGRAVLHRRWSGASPVEHFADGPAQADSR